jgi:hypothetical protein
MPSFQFAKNAVVFAKIIPLPAQLAAILQKPLTVIMFHPTFAAH